MNTANDDSLLMRDSKYIWHPFTQVGLAEPMINLVRGEQEFLFDVSGKKYIDAISSWWVNLHGHAQPEIAAAIARQACTLEHAIFAGFTHEPAVDLADKLISYFNPAFAKLFFSDNGSTAVEVGLKLALQYWYNKAQPRAEIERTKILAFEGAYHGDTFGAMAVGERSLFTRPFQAKLFDVTFLPSPTLDNKLIIETVLSRLNLAEYAVIIYEPLLQGAGGMIMHDHEVLRALLMHCRHHGLLLLADEVLTGFGRTGKMFASEYFAFMPDIMALSKGITGGFLPLGATLVTDAIEQEFRGSDHSKTFFHGHSYTGSPLACAAANASFNLLCSEETQRKIAAISAAHNNIMGELSRVPGIKNLRRLGTVLAMEVETPGAAGQKSYTHKLKDVLYRGFIDEGVLLRPLGNTLYILPPFCIMKESLERVYSAVIKVVGSL